MRQETMRQDAPVSERPGDRYWRLISKLRWIGMDEEAARIEAKLQLLPRARRERAYFQVSDTD